MVSSSKPGQLGFCARIVPPEAVGKMLSPSSAFQNGHFQPRAVCSPGSSLVEPELTDEDDTSTSEFLQVGKVNMSCICCLIFQGCPPGSGRKIIVDILKSSLRVCLTRQILASLVAQMVRNLPAV